MEHVLIFALVGFAAQFLGGALGMGYGITCTSMLLLMGLTPVAASTSVHATEAITGIVVGLSHWRLGNVNWRLTLGLAVPGCVGAVLGATVLTSLPTAHAKPFMAGMLMLLGVFVFVRFLRGRVDVLRGTSRIPGGRVLTPLGIFAGFVDATGGGGWGALSTSTLLGTGKIEPRIVVGSVDAAKCIVSFAAVLALLRGSEGALHAGVVLPLILGGVVAAPLAAVVVTTLRPQLFGVIAGVVIILVNLPVALAFLPGPALVALALAVVALGAGVGVWGLRRPLPAKTSALLPAGGAAAD